MNLLPANKEKSCCWNCLKVLLKDQAIDKHFEEKIIKLKVVKKLKSLILTIIYIKTLLKFL